MIGGAIAANLVIGLPMLILGAWPVLRLHGPRRLAAVVAVQAQLPRRAAQRDAAADRPRADRRCAWRPTASARSTGSTPTGCGSRSTEERLVVTSRGNRAVIGRFLGPDERVSVADQLKAAIADMRAPRYDHAWDEYASASDMPSPPARSVGEREGPAQRGGEVGLRLSSTVHQAPPHLPVAAQRVPSSPPLRGGEDERRVRAPARPSCRRGRASCPPATWPHVTAPAA